MSNIATILKQARESARLSLEDLATWSRIEIGLLRDAETARTRLTAAQLDRVACAYGLRLHDLLDGQAGTAPMTLLLRSGADDPQLDIRSVLTTEVDQALGEFQRVIRDVAELDDLLGRHARPLPQISTPLTSKAIHPGDQRARDVRALLNLGADPIPSVKRVVESLGIFIVWVTEDQVARLVEGACIRTPRPAILVNIIEEGRHPWRARMTLAHELGHLLFDLTSPTRHVLVSPAGDGMLPPWLRELEQNARAFAACFLVPSEGIAEVVGNLDPTSELAIHAVGKHFGVGRTVVINRLQHVYGFTNEQRSVMEYGRRQLHHYEGDFSADAAPRETGLRGDPFQSLVGEALELGKITPDRARALLRIDLTEPLPFPHLPILSAPTMPIEQKLFRAAAMHLAQKDGGEGLVALEPEHTGEVWRVPVAEGGIGATERRLRGHLVLSDDGRIIHDRTE